MTEQTGNKVSNSVKVDGDVMNLLIDEQVRLRRASGRRVTYSDLLRKMWASYKPSIDETVTNVTIANDTDSATVGPYKSERRRWHDMLDRILDARGAYKTAIIANLEGWSRAVLLEDRRPDQNPARNTEEKEDRIARTLANARGVNERAKADREGIGRDENAVTPGPARRGKR